MNRQSKLSSFFRYFIFLLLIGLGNPSSLAYSATVTKKKLDINAFHLNHVSDTKLKTENPEMYLESSFKQGLNTMLPKTIQRNLKLDPGYDKWEGLPTLQAEFFLPFADWSDKSIFLTPRMSLTGSKESFSLGIGTRHMITADTMFGVHVFHDWIRSRRLKEEFLKEIGVGMELSMLPGHYSDLNVSFNAYFPLNERYSLKNDATVLVREIQPTGYDSKVSFLLPALVKPLDIQIDAQIHSYRAEKVNLFGYKTGLTFRSRNGMLSTTIERGTDSRFGDNYRIEGNLTLAFDWNQISKGNNPFSAPYSMSDLRFNRKVHDSLYQKVSRKHDLPTGRSESKVTLLADVSDHVVSFSGGFPHLPYATVTLQTSQSPWEDFREVVTDGAGSYAGQVALQPGIYRVRLIHKPTGRVSNTQTIVVEDKKQD
jgi:hypothetical protein